MDSTVGVNLLRELQGVMKNFGAQQGLLISWGRFRDSVLAEAIRLFFDIRLWGAGELVKTLLENYERLLESFQVELPLKPMKPIWVLIPEG